MSIRQNFLILFILMLSCGTAFAVPGVSVGDGSGATYGTSIRLSSELACDGTTDDRAKLAALLASDGKCDGKNCIIPSGCTILLSSPGAGSAAATLRSGTRLTCEDSYNTTFKLARHYCDSGTYAGSYCDTSTACRSGSCVCSTGSGDGCEFAPSSGSTYTVLSASSGATGIGFTNCKIDAGQVEPFGRCATGSDAGKPCSVNGDCNASTCTAVPKSPTGTGTINILDFDDATVDARISGNTIINVAKTTGVILTGTGATVEKNVIGSHSSPVAPTLSVSPTIGLGAYSIANGNRITNSNLGIKSTAADTKITDNDIINPSGTATAIQTHDRATVKGNRWTLVNNSGSTGIIVTGSSGAGNTVVTGNNGTGVQNTGGTHTKCGQTQVVFSGNNFAYGGYGSVPYPDSAYPSNPTAPAINCRYVGNNYYAQSVLGAAIITGNEFVGNYVSWGNQALSIGYDDGTIAVGNAHSHIHDNLFHSPANSNTLIKLVDGGMRCSGDAEWNKACTCTPSAVSCTGSNDDCQDDGGGAYCNAMQFADISISDNIFLFGGTSTLAIDLTMTSDYTLVSGIQIMGNVFDGHSSSGTAITFPSQAADAANIVDVSVRENRFKSTATPIANWLDTMGVMGGNTNAGVTDTQANYIYLTNRTGSSVTAGQVMEAYNGGSSYDNAAQQAVAGSVQPIGILTTTTADAVKAQIATFGQVAKCAVSTAAVARGECLKVSSTDGKLSTSATGDNCFAIAEGAKSAGSAGYIPCFVTGRGVTTQATGSTTVTGSFSSLQTSNGAAAKYGSIFGQSAMSVTESAWQVTWHAGSITGLRCTLTAAPGTTSVRTFTIMNGTSGATSAACSITGSAKTCTWSGSVSWSDAQKIDMRSSLSTADAASAEATCTTTFTMT